jgi:hypothetical protein
MIRVIHNAETGEIKEELMTADEIENFENYRAQIAAAEDQMFNAKSALLEKLGITEDEAKLLLS